MQKNRPQLKKNRWLLLTNMFEIFIGRKSFPSVTIPKKSVRTARSMYGAYFPMCLKESCSRTRSARVMLEEFIKTPR